MKVILKQKHMLNPTPTDPKMCLYLFTSYYTFLEHWFLAYNLFFYPNALNKQQALKSSLSCLTQTSRTFVLSLIRLWKQQTGGVCPPKPMAVARLRMKTCMCSTRPVNRKLMECFYFLAGCVKWSCCVSLECC